MKQAKVTKGGTFTINGEDLALKPGDDVPGHLVDAAIAHGWGKAKPAQPARKQTGPAKK